MRQTRVENHHSLSKSLLHKYIPLLRYCMDVNFWILYTYTYLKKTFLHLFAKLHFNFKLCILDIYESLFYNRDLGKCHLKSLSLKDFYSNWTWKIRFLAWLMSYSLKIPNKKKYRKIWKFNCKASHTSKRHWKNS